MTDYNPRNKRMLVLWFDPMNTRHLEAYAHLRATGMWPTDFIDVLQIENVVFHEAWQSMLDSRLALLFVTERLAAS